jgi:hypothetical protein
MFPFLNSVSHQDSSPAPVQAFWFQDSIHKKSNITEKMSKDISDKITAAESLSSMSSKSGDQAVFEINSLELACGNWSENWSLLASQ